MSGELLNDALRLLSPHLWAVALCSARLLPVVFLCPLLGGALAPSFVKLALVLSLATCLHLGGGVGLDPALAPDVVSLTAALFRELLLGLSIGLLASLPFDAARMGGTFADLFRGSSAEAALPFAGSREAASGDFLYQLMLALAISGIGLPVVLSALWKSFQLMALGQFIPTEAGALHVVQWAMAAVGTALAVGAPVAGAALAVDLLLGMVSRYAPQMNLQDSGAPLRLLAGGAVLWLSVGLLSERLLGFLGDVEGSVAVLLERAF